MITVACDETHSGKHAICVYDLERVVSTRITDGSRDPNPIWTRDDKEITYESRDGKVATLRNVAIDRSTPPRVLLSGGRLSPWTWLEDERLLYGTVEEGESRSYLASGGQTAFLWPGAELQVSPNGKWIAQAGVLVRSLAEPGVRIQISNNGTQPRWSSDGRHLFYIAADKKMMAVTFDPVNGTASAPWALFQTRIIGTRITGTQYDIAPDGRFLINSPPSNSSPLTLMTGWTGLLKPR
jgi:Tol biopolymer transport system component